MRNVKNQIRASFNSYQSIRRGGIDDTVSFGIQRLVRIQIWDAVRERVYFQVRNHIWTELHEQC